MRIGYMSDLHAEFHRDNGQSLALEIPKCDVLVLAGDIMVGKLRYVNVFDHLLDRAKHIVFVTGNHEYYGTSPEKAHKVLSDYAKATPNFHWLDRGTVNIEGQRFVGASLWFKKTATADRHREWLNDFSVIEAFSHWWPEQARKDEAFLESTVRADDIVITHHLPSHKSVAPEYQGNPYNCYFVNDVEAIIEKRQPKVWIHGHTHNSCQYQIGETKVLCNPFGYAGREENPAFNVAASFTV